MAPLGLALGVSVIVPFLAVSRKEYAVAFATALVGVIAPAGIVVGAKDALAGDFGLQARLLLLFWPPVIIAPALVASVEAMRGRAVSWRGVVAGAAFLSIYATILLSHFARTGGPGEGLLGTLGLVGWLLAPAAIVAVAYSLGVRKDDKLREARERAAGTR